MSPATIARQTQAKREANARRILDQRRKDAARHGYRGPLTRAELIIPQQRTR